MLKIADEAPDFTLPDDRGNQVKLSDLRQSHVVLYFYPKDDTSGCTREAKDFSGLSGEFASLGVHILGISKDSAEKHMKFRKKHQLNVTLLSDNASDVCERYGVWKEKSMYGKTYMGIERTTFYIGPNGSILKIWNKVRVPGHAEDVLATARELHLPDSK
ncbi:MAG: thioredoxin-dependent thiol peroxidase [Roseovarius sp.]|nr:thioredoxin-dependent thiol peroxidase [Roseovarius sp.]MCY4208131.1 thioredoxin-dependent thiol peroxidase [Roseovarius sp.]MCY4292132.1 thioredoxin-dependent thiol peroxidase [Roseovarius sp.]